MPQAVLHPRATDCSPRLAADIPPNGTPSARQPWSVVDDGLLHNHPVWSAVVVPVCRSSRSQGPSLDLHNGPTVPLLQAVIPWIGHQQTRNRGTVGGSLAHADPSAELPLIALILKASIHCESKQDGSRKISAEDFFQGPMWTSLQANECLTQIDWPLWSGAFIGYDFEETAIRQGDFAMASAASQIQVDHDGKVLKWNCGVGGMGGTPYQFDQLTNQFLGQTLSKEKIIDFSSQAIALTDPTSDLHASSSYRKHLAKALLSRTIEKSLLMAQSNTQPNR